MKSTGRWGVGICLVVPVLAIGVQTQPRIQPETQTGTQNGKPVNPPIQTATPETVAKAEAAVALAEKEVALANEQHKAGIISTDSLLLSNIKATQAQMHLAELKKQPEVILQLAKSIVAEQEQRTALTEQLYKAGMVTATELIDARIKLSEARIQLELRNIIDLREKNLAYLTELYKQGQTTQPEVQAATTALREARSRLVKE